ncbi:MAG TPA: chemotaxis protein CheA [Acetobacteraceae bacterium]|nr:chemotaxis protein CheA [Acetobacteraceae bacterium]
MDELLAEFLTETNEGLAELDVALLRLERVPDDPDTLALIFRMIHTIKGTCGFLGLPRLEAVAHAGEAVLVAVRDGSIPVAAEIITLVLEALDRIKQILAGLAASGNEPAGDDTALIAALEQAGQAPAPPPACETAPTALPMAPTPPATAHTDPVPVTPTIRVQVEVLENLMTLVSELVLTRNQLLQLARGDQGTTLAAPLQLLSQITSELQAGIMKTRMQPVGTLWNKLPRMLRDLSLELGKPIELVLRGAETELDRRVLDLIRDPLTHMVRNAADHGLEQPDERRAAGKPQNGTILLTACHESGHVIIEVTDDGRGLSTERIRAKAIAQGLATEAELAGMSKSQLHRLIFRPGFSTASAVTAVSGRGVGMDVVKSNIEQMGGTINLSSTPGTGTTITIRIPLTLAIVAALVVGAGGMRFAIPQLGVVELVGLAGTGATEGAVIERIDHTRVLRLRDRLLPLASLTELLHLPPSRGDATAPVVVVIRSGTGLLGLIVDQVFDTEEIVVKPVAPILRQITLFGGTTILGDGSVIIILDPNAMARTCGISADTETRSTDAPGARGAVDQTPLLLFRAGGPHLMAVPLGLVSRIEEIARTAVEPTAGHPVTQYRGRLMPLIALANGLNENRPQQTVLVFADAARCVGLMVDEIVDVVQDRLDIELAGARRGLLGTAVLAGRAADVIDVSFWLERACTSLPGLPSL